MSDRRVYYIVFEGKDNTSKVVNGIGETYKRLQKEINKPITESQDKSASYKTASYNAALKDIDRMRKENLRWEKAVAAEIAKTDKTLADNKIREAKRSANAVITELNQIRKATEQKNTSGGGFGQDLFGTIFGATTASGLAINAISAAISEIKSLASATVDLGIKSVQLAADYEVTRNAITLFAGGTGAANRELEAIIKTARNTEGLRLEPAEAGYKTLRALNFEMETARSLTAGLGKFRILSGADEQSVQRVLVNFQQISTTTARFGQDYKEIIHAIPALKSAFKDAFGTTDRNQLKKFFDENPDEAFKKLAQAMEKTKGVSGGLNGAFGKLSDEWILAGRAFGEPFLEPVTRDVKDLTTFLRENSESWREWGKSVSDAYRGASQVLRFIGAPGISGGNADEPASISKYAILDTLFGGAYVAYEGSQALGRRQRLAEEEALRNRKGGLSGDTSSLDRTSYDTFLNPDGTLRFRQQGEIKKDEERAAAQAEKQAELARIKELAGIKANAKETNAIYKNRFEIEQSLRDANVRYTAKQEFDYQVKSGAARSQFIQAEILRTSAFYDKQIALQKDNEEEVAELQKEKNIALSNLNKDLRINEINTQKAIKEQQRRILEERRQAQVNFLGLQIQEIQQNADRQNSVIQQGLAEGALSYQQGYAEQIRISSDSLQQITRFNKQQLALQLQDKSLTEEQKTNLIKQSLLNEQKLAQDNNERIFQINQQRLQLQKSQIDDLFNYISSNISARSSFIQDFTGLLFGEGSTFKRSGEIFANILEAQKRGYLELREQARTGVNTDLIDRTRAELNAIKPLLAEMARLQSGFGGKPEDVDILNIETIRARQQAETEALNARISAQNAIYNQTTDQIQKEKENYVLQGLIQERTALGIKNLREQEEAYRNSIDGIREYNKALAEGDVFATAFAKNKAIKSREQEVTGLRESIIALNDRIANSSVNNELQIQVAHLQDILSLRQKETDAVIQINRIQTELQNKLNFSQNQSDAQVLEHINGQVKDLSTTFADFRIGLSDSFTNAITSPFDALEKKIDKLSPALQGLARTFLDLGRDILKAFSHKLILQLFGLQSAPSGNSGGGFLSNIFGSIFGGGRAGGNLTLPGGFGTGASGTNPNIFSFGGNSGFVPFGQATGAANPLSFILGGGGVRNASGGDFLSSLFSAQGLTGAAATAGISVGVQALIASLQTHSPAKGALLGGAVGFIAGLLNRNNRRKREEKQRSQFINDAFTGLKAFDQLIADVRALRIQPPESALTQGQTLADNIRQTYLQQAGALKDKKTRNIALKDVSRIDDIVKQKMEELRKMVSIAQAAGERERRILPEFATGYFADFFKPNGLIPGTFDRKDDILAMISRGEMVLNPQQQHRIRQASGFDVFAHAEIPNYPARQKNAIPKLTTGAIVTGGGMQIKAGDLHVKVELHNVNTTPDSRLVLSTPDGKEQVINIWKDAAKTYKITTADFKK